MIINFRTIYPYLFTYLPFPNLLLVFILPLASIKVKKRASVFGFSIPRGLMIFLITSGNISVSVAAQWRFP